MFAEYGFCHQLSCGFGGEFSGEPSGCQQIFSVNTFSGSQLNCETMAWNSCIQNRFRNRVEKQLLILQYFRNLREIHCGEWEEAAFGEMLTRWPDSYPMWLNDIGHVQCPGGESVKDVLSRVLPLLTDLARKHEGENEKGNKLF